MVLVIAKSLRGHTAPVWGPALGLSLILLVAAPFGAATAQTVDIGFGYAARATQPTTDNDLVGFSGGLTWERPFGGLRLGGFAGVRNEDFSGDYPSVLSVDVLGFRGAGAVQRGYGANLTWSEDREISFELATGLQSFWDRASVRGTVGAETLENSLYGQSDSGLFGVGEYSWYSGDDWALRLGGQADSGGTVAALAGEWRIGNSGLALSVEYALGLGDYRDVDGYDDLTIHLSFAPGFNSLKERDRKLPTRLLRRYVAAQ